MLAIIAGSGLSPLAELYAARKEIMRTPFGDPSSALLFGKMSDKEVVFLARHGHGHTISPHEVNYRANIWALKECGVTKIVSVASAGAINDQFRVGQLVCPHQLIDYTSGRKATFSEGAYQAILHIDFTEPFDESLRLALLNAAQSAKIAMHQQAVCAVTQGPRLETAAEINRLAKDGAEIVGMTNMPEAILARELNLAYAAINIITNQAAGRFNAEHKITLEHLEEVQHQAMLTIQALLQAFLKAP